MQYKLTEYDEKLHDIFSCLSVKDPYATMIAQGKKTIELRSRDVKFRGQIIICCSSTPQTGSSGHAIAVSELYDTKRAKDLTPEEWDMTGIPALGRPAYSKKVAWMLRDSKPIKPVPVKGQLGIYRIALSKGDINI